MAWRHQWGPPQLTTIRIGTNALSVPRQTCTVCGTTRNPFNNVITHFAKSAVCRDLTKDPEQMDHTMALRDLEVMIASLARQGEEAVDKWHTGRKRKRDVPELPLPYRD